MNKPTKSVATTGTFSSAKMPVAATPSLAKYKAKGKAAKSRPSEDSDEEQKMDMEENDDSDVVLVNEVKPRKKLVEWVTGDPRRGISMVKLQASRGQQRGTHVRG